MTAQSDTQPASAKRAFWLGVAAYLLPSFPIAYAWHLVVFADAYHALSMYRDTVIVPFGLLSMVIQGLAFSWAYPHAFPERGRKFLANGLTYGAAIGVLSWSFTTLAVAAKNVMESVPDYLMLETGFTVVQFLVVGPAIAFAYRR
jgi:hypothetical protein